MKRLSITAIVEHGLDTLRRFPLVMASAALFTCSVIAECEDERYALVGVLGISLMLAITLMAERGGWSLPVRGGAWLAGAGVLVLTFMLLGEENVNEMEVQRYLMHLTATHLLVACAPFLVRGEINGFWQYNRVLFVRALTAALYTGVLFAGLSLAIAAVDRLFDADISTDAYRNVGAFLGGIFCTWFFLAGVPRRFSELDAVPDYPKALKAFTQYVLLPLVSIYLAILYLYAGKIIITWEWPRGWVSGLILGFAVTGILSFLLLYPIRDRDGNGWIRKFNAGFYYALLPLTVLLFLSIWVRLSTYGFTESRYIVVVLAFWLAGIALYFIISRRDNIKVVPISLCLVAVGISFGPWGAFEVSLRDQAARLEETLVQEKILVNGKIVPRDTAVADSVETTISSIFYYLNERDRLDIVYPWFPDSVRGWSVYQIIDLLKLNGTEGDHTESVAPAIPDDIRVAFSLIDRDILNVSGFDYTLRFSSSGLRSGRRMVEYLVGEDSVKVVYNADGTLEVQREGRGVAGFPLKKFVLGIHDSLGIGYGHRDPPDYELEGERLTLASNDSTTRLTVIRAYVVARENLGDFEVAVLLKR